MWQPSENPKEEITIMNKIRNSTWKRITIRGLLVAACIISLAMQPFTASAAVQAVPTTLPVLWTAGGLTSGNDGAGNSANMTVDGSGNIAVVSGPSLGRDLAVTSYTATGTFRWRSTVSPSVGTMAGGWVVAAPNGDFVTVGYYLDSHGFARGTTLVRFASDGTLRWRLDLVALVTRVVVDTGGNTYLAYGAQDIQVHKYSPTGALLWTAGATGTFNASSLALSPDQTDVVLTGSINGGATWMTAAFNAATGVRRWQVAATEGIAALDVIVDATRVYVTGQGNVGINGFLTVIAYDRATGARLWRTDANPPTCCAIGSRIALAPDGSLVVAGRTATGGYFDWWIVAMNTDGTVKWQALRDAAVSGDEFPAAIFVLADGTTVVSGTGGPVTHDILGNSYMQGVTAGYSSNGTLLWEGFSKLPTVWATALPNGDVCATGGYDALITCWRPSGGVTPSPTPDPTTIPTNTPVAPTPTNTPPPSKSTGFLSPSANAAQMSSAGDNNGYQTSPANAYANDSLVAVDTNSGTNTSTSCTNNGKDKQRYYNYNLKIPAAAVIKGIQVRLDASVDATSGSPKICVQLSWDGGTTWTTAKSTTNLSTTEATYTLGSISDVWGRSWTSNDFSNANFRIRVIDVASNTSRDFFLDYVAVNVTYQP
jgi:hypothetical protein